MEMLSDFKNYAINLFSDMSSGLQTKILIGTAAALSIGFIFFLRRRKSIKDDPQLSRLPLPPGPSSSFILAGFDFDHKKLMGYYSKYGDVVYFKQMGINFIILSGFATLKQAFLRTKGGEPFSDHATGFIDFIFRNRGIATADGERWLQNRRFVLHKLRDLGMGKTYLEVAIQSEANHLVEELGVRARGQPIDPSATIVRIVNNVISQLVFGRNCSDEPHFEKALDYVTRMIEYSQPAERKLPRLLSGPYRFGYAIVQSVKMLAFWLLLDRYIGQRVEIERRAYERGGPDLRDTLLNSYFAEQKLQDEQHGPGKHNFDSLQIRRVGLEMFMAGTQTTVTALRWALILLARHPEVQQRVRDEIDSVLGDRELQWADRTRLRYTEATICEVLRFATIFPFGTRKMRETIEFKGFRLPRGSLILSNLFSVHRDSNIWPHPDDFDPENFLERATAATAPEVAGDADGAEQLRLVRTESLLSFSIGKRECPGESLARQELLFFLVRLMQRFTVREPSDAGTTGTRPVKDFDVPVMNMFFRTPKSYPLVFEPRSHA